MSELNPNHAATISLREHWHKLAALLMVKFGKTEVEITIADVALLGDDKNAIVIDQRGGRLILRMVSMEEASRLAREEGGLPV